MGKNYTFIYLNLEREDRMVPQDPLKLGAINATDNEGKPVHLPKEMLYY